MRFSKQQVTGAVLILLLIFALTLIRYFAG
jgi:hypothetical protein